MTKILEIKSCWECKFFHTTPLCNKKHKKIPRGKNTFLEKHFPCWCPLRDKPKPMTVKQLAEWSKEIHNWQEVVDEINAHFLGAMEE